MCERELGRASNFEIVRCLSVVFETLNDWSFLLCAILSLCCNLDLFGTESGLSIFSCIHSVITFESGLLN